MIIGADDIFIYPTDTVWGIGCSLYSKKGYQKILEIKKREEHRPFSIMFSTMDEIYKSFTFPNELTVSWLTDFFKLETTLGLPISTLKIKIPAFATGESQFICIRFLKTSAIKTIYDQIQAPFFTTSLNFSGDPPIINRIQAYEFFKSNAPDAHFIESTNQKDLSGSPSTIVFMNNHLEFEIKREGAKVLEVKAHLENFITFL